MKGYPLQINEALRAYRRRISRSDIAMSGNVSLLRNGHVRMGMRSESATQTQDTLVRGKRKRLYLGAELLFFSIALTD